MSLTLLTIAGISAALSGRGGKSGYLMGCDVLGAETPISTDANAPAVRVVNPSDGNYWTSVAAGLTVVVLAIAANYAYHKARDWPHHLDGAAKDLL